LTATSYVSRRKVGIDVNTPVVTSYCQPHEWHLAQWRSNVPSASATPQTSVVNSEESPTHAEQRHDDIAYDDARCMSSTGRKRAFAYRAQKRQHHHVVIVYMRRAGRG
jgi:hypothetical protein